MSTFFKVEDRTTTWLVRVVGIGEHYGQWNADKGTFALTHDGAASLGPLVEFYDAEQDRSEPFQGQFVQRYFLSTFTGRSGGLCLEGSDPRCTVSSTAMSVIQNWLFNHQDVGQSAKDPAVHERVTVAFVDASGAPGFRTSTVYLKESEKKRGLHFEKALATFQSEGIQSAHVLFDSSQENAIVLKGREIENRGTFRSDKQQSRDVDLQLAALRWFQSCIGSGSGVDMSEVDDICDLDTITRDEIDALCERINFGD